MHLDPNQDVPPSPTDKPSSFFNLTRIGGIFDLGLPKHMTIKMKKTLSLDPLGLFPPTCSWNRMRFSFRLQLPFQHDMVKRTILSSGTGTNPLQRRGWRRLPFTPPPRQPPPPRPVTVWQPVYRPRFSITLKPGLEHDAPDLANQHRPWWSHVEKIELLPMERQVKAFITPLRIGPFSFQIIACHNLVANRASLLYRLGPIDTTSASTLQSRQDAPPARHEVDQASSLHAPPHYRFPLATLPPPLGTLQLHTVLLQSAEIPRIEGGIGDMALGLGRMQLGLMGVVIPKVQLLLDCDAQNSRRSGLDHPRALLTAWSKRVKPSSSSSSLLGRMGRVVRNVAMSLGTSVLTVGRSVVQAATSSPPHDATPPRPSSWPDEFPASWSPPSILTPPPPSSPPPPLTDETSDVSSSHRMIRAAYRPSIWKL